MTPRSPYAVPLASLDGVRVGVTEQVQEQAEPVVEAAWGAGLLPVGDGGGGCDADGD